MTARPLLALTLALLLGVPAIADEPAALRSLSPGRLVAQWKAGGAVARKRIEAELRRRGVRMVHVVRDALAGTRGPVHRGLTRLAARIVEEHHRRHQPPGMIYVPAGSLEVPRERIPYGASGVRTQVPAFYLDRTEVTVGAWRRWLEQRKAAGIEEPRMPVPDPKAPASFPMTRVSWEEAGTFARESRGGRLPRAEEMERAVRGSGLATWPWGEVYRTGRARLGYDNDDGPAPVGSYPKVTGPFGALDLVGNVAEWTATTRQAGRAFRSRKALLFGGSFRDQPDAALTWRSPRKSAGLERDRRRWIGFRVARDVPPIPPRKAR